MYIPHVCYVIFQHLSCQPDESLTSLVTTNKIINVYDFLVVIMLLMYSAPHCLHSVGKNTTTTIVGHRPGIHQLFIRHAQYAHTHSNWMVQRSLITISTSRRVYRSRMRISHKKYLNDSQTTKFIYWNELTKTWCQKCFFKYHRRCGRVYYIFTRFYSTFSIRYSQWFGDESVFM